VYSGLGWLQSRSGRNFAKLRTIPHPICEAYRTGSARRRYTFKQHTYTKLNLKIYRFPPLVTSSAQQTAQTLGDSDCRAPSVFVKPSRDSYASVGTVASTFTKLFIASYDSSDNTMADMASPLRAADKSIVDLIPVLNVLNPQSPLRG
jgi:hypothetical protein